MDPIGILLAPISCLAGLKIGRILFPRPFLQDRYLLGLFRSGAGLIVIAFILFGMVLSGIATVPGLWSLTGLLFAAGFSELIKKLRRIKEITGILYAHCGVLILLVFYFSFQVAMTFLPPSVRDELIYHLYVPQKWIETGGGFFFRDNIYAYFPQLADVYFLLGLGTFGEPAAKFFHVMWGGLLALALYRFSRKWLGRTLAWVPALVFLAVPSVMVVMNWAYVDLTFSFYALMALILLMEFHETRDPHAWIACGVMAGGAAATKYTGIQFALLLAGLFLILEKKQRPEKIVMQILTLGGIAGLVLLPYLVRNFIQTGWPLFPFSLPGFALHSVNWDADRARLFIGWLQTFGTRIGSENFWDTALAPFRVFFAGRFNDHSRFEGVLGPVFLLTPVFFRKIKQDKKIRALAFFSLLFLFYWTFTTKQARFLFPVLPVLSLLLVYGAWRTGKRWVLLGVVAAALAFSWPGVREIAKTDPLPYLLGKESREDFLGRRIDVYRIYHAARKILKENDRLYFLDMKNYGYLLKMPWRGDYVFEHYSLQRFLKSAKDPAEAARFFSDQGITHVLMNQDLTLSKTMGLEDREAELFVSFLRGNATPLLVHDNYVLFKLEGGSLS